MLQNSSRTGEEQQHPSGFSASINLRDRFLSDGGVVGKAAANIVDVDRLISATRPGRALQESRSTFGVVHGYGKMRLGRRAPRFRILAAAVSSDAVSGHARVPFGSPVSPHTELSVAIEFRPARGERTLIHGRLQFS